MKRYVDELLGLYAALANDAKTAYPALSAELDRDLLRLTRLSNCRGITIFMVDLPQLCKHLDRCLALGQYSPSGLPISRRVSKRVEIPKLFRGFYLLIFDKCGSLKEKADVEAILLLRQLLLLGKKATIDCSEDKIRREVVEFVQADTRLPCPPASWADPTKESLGADHPGFAQSFIASLSGALPLSKATRILRLLDDISRRISLTLGPYRFEDWEFKHGPGSVSDRSSGEDRFSFPNWCSRLDRVFPYADVAFHNFSAWARKMCCSETSPVGGEEPTSFLVAVPKTLSKPRLIACEPSEMMFCQQNVWQYFKTRVEGSWISTFVRFTDQTQNQRLARIGSVDGSLVTLDLSSASDSVTPSVVGNLFRANLGLLEALAATRTRFLEIPEALGEPKLVELRKYSTMGNATTFPVETLVFLACALACTCEELGLIPGEAIALQDKVSIFGDDIIVPKQVAGSLIALLEALGFKVNADKSYLDGQFRESCGVDAFRGVCVTPAYWRGPLERCPESVMSRIAVSNNFYKRFFVSAARYIQARMGRIRFPLVPVDSGVSGFHSFVDPMFASFPRRWNKDLQREEVRIPILSNRSETRSRDTIDTYLHQFFTEQPDPWIPWRGGVRCRPVGKIAHRWVSVTQPSQAENS